MVGFGYQVDVIHQFFPAVVDDIMGGHGSFLVIRFEKIIPLEGDPCFGHKGLKDRLVGLKDFIAKSFEMEGDGGLHIG